MRNEEVVACFEVSLLSQRLSEATEENEKFARIADLGAEI
jgi:hypothetical protein